MIQKEKKKRKKKHRGRKTKTEKNPKNELEKMLNLFKRTHIDCCSIRIIKINNYFNFTEPC